MCQLCINQLNPEQHSAFEQIVDSISMPVALSSSSMGLEEQGRHISLQYPLSQGKCTVTYDSESLLLTVLLQVRGEGRIVLCVASSGIASILLPGGRTAHSRFKIPVENLHAHSTCSVTKESTYAALLLTTDIIIWDEAGNQHRWAPEAVDRLMKDLKNSDKPFGGVTVVFGGNFQQTLPVIVRGSRADIVSATLLQSYLWSHIKVLRLWHNMCLKQAPENAVFAQWLLDIDHGRVHVDGDYTKIAIPSHMLRHSVDNLISSIYHDMDTGHAPPPPKYFLNRIILSTRNEDI